MNLLLFNQRWWKKKMNQKPNNDERVFAIYKHNIQREKRRRLIFQNIKLLAIFLRWEWASRLYWIDPLIFSTPSQIYHLLYEKFSDGSMFMHIQMTLLETIFGFILGTLLGIMIASVLWASERLANILDP